jgi:hypothetical protein
MNLVRVIDMVRVLLPFRLNAFPIWVQPEVSPAAVLMDLVGLCARAVAVLTSAHVRG